MRALHSDTGLSLSKQHGYLPKAPLKSDHGHDTQGLEYHGQRRLAARHPSIQKTDARDNEEDQHAGEVLVDIVELQALIGRVHVDELRIATVGKAAVVFGEMLHKGHG